jgi:uncharacterized protein YutE (UPF0331/DUF86 family)
VYFVDREQLEKRLTYFEGLVSDFKQLPKKTNRETSLMTERLCHMMIEVVMDTGNHMIDGFIMRDPGSYEDIINILVDEHVLTEEEGNDITTLIPWRKELLQNYTELDVAALSHAFQKNIDTLSHFPYRLRCYLENELGPVSAFLPKKREVE